MWGPAVYTHATAAAGCSSHRPSIRALSLYKAVHQQACANDTSSNDSLHAVSPASVYCACTMSTASTPQQLSASTNSSPSTPPLGCSCLPGCLLHPGWHRSERNVARQPRQLDPAVAAEHPWHQHEVQRHPAAATSLPAATLAGTAAQQVLLGQDRTRVPGVDVCVAS